MKIACVKETIFNKIMCAPKGTPVPEVQEFSKEMVVL